MFFCVEDDDAIRGLMLYALKAAGFETRGFADGESLALTFKEFELLRLFLSSPGVVFTREALQSIWGSAEKSGSGSP